MSKHIIFIFLTLSLHDAWVQFEFVCLFVCSSASWKVPHVCFLLRSGLASFTSVQPFQETTRSCSDRAGGGCTSQPPPSTPLHGKTRRKEATLLLVFYQERNGSVVTFISASCCVLSEVFSATSAPSPVCVCACVWCGVCGKVLQRCKHTNSAS